MARPVTTTEPQSKRTTSVTWGTVAEKKDWQDYAKRRGTNLANLIKMLLAADAAKHPAPAPPAE